MEKHAQGLDTADLLRVIRAFNHAGTKPAPPGNQHSHSRWLISSLPAHAQVKPEFVKTGPAGQKFHPPDQAYLRRCASSGEREE
jgi:hypothetical protein